MNQHSLPRFSKDFLLVLSTTFLIGVSVVVLRSLVAEIFPFYLIYIFVALLFLYVFSKIDFEIFVSFSPHLYVFSLVLLLLTLIIGNITRGAVRWIPLGKISIQPSEVVRPFLILFFAKYAVSAELSVKRLVKLVLVFLIPFFLILIQPSLGVAILTFIGFFGVVIASSFPKKYLLLGTAILLAVLPLVYFVLQPYQRLRINTFLDPSKDPYGAGYNSIQSMISVGSGGVFGRGLGKGIQTQLAFLPERHTDFIFASIAEELGLMGAFLVILGLFAVFWRIINIIENSQGPVARAFVSGVFLVLFAETFIHIGMNVGLLPITGVPLPFISAGGSALIGTMMSIALVLSARK
jgi:rod shape determining protein RodA